MEHESFTHSVHEHPLSLIPDWSQNRFYEPWCHGCWRKFLPGDAIYGCGRRCGFRSVLHKECMEMPREIVHPIHPSHPLTLHDSEGIHNSEGISELIKCAVCEELMLGLGYRCSQGGCDGLWIHMGCADDVLNDKNEKEPLMKHPSHPHELRFSKKTRWCPFPCNACGATEKGDSYTCTVCDYCIHQSCALLPMSKDFPHHQHTLPSPSLLRVSTSNMNLIVGYATQLCH